MSGEMENMKHDSLDAWAESNAGRRVLHSNNVPVIIAVVLKTQKEGNITFFFFFFLKRQINMQPFETLQSELNQLMEMEWHPCYHSSNVTSSSRLTSIDIVQNEHKAFNSKW